MVWKNWYMTKTDLIKSCDINLKHFYKLCIFNGKQWTIFCLYKIKYFSY